MLTHKTSSHKKYCKKYEFLQLSLNNFLNWRKKHDSLILSKVPQDLVINHTLEQELFLIKKIPLFSIKRPNYQNELNLVTSSWQQSINRSFSPKNVFLNKLPFIQYWVFPFCGFLMFTIKMDNMSIFFQNIENNSKNFNERKNRYSNKSSGVLSQVVFGNKSVHNDFVKLRTIETKELQHLTNYYYTQLAIDFKYNNSKEHETIQIQNPFGLKSSLDYFTIRKKTVSNFHWTWFPLINKTLKPLKLETNFVEKTLNKGEFVNYIQMPEKLNPLSGQYVLNKIRGNVKRQQNQKDFFNSINDNFKNQENPIESYKVAAILLETLLKKNFIDINSTSYDAIRKKEFEFKFQNHSKFFKIINQLYLENQTSQINLIDLKNKDLNTNQTLATLRMQKNLEIRTQLHLSKLKIQQDLDKLYLLKHLKFKNKVAKRKLSTLQKTEKQKNVFNNVVKSKFKSELFEFENSKDQNKHLIYSKIDKNSPSFSIFQNKILKEFFQLFQQIQIGKTLLRPPQTEFLFSKPLKAFRLNNKINFIGKKSLNWLTYELLLLKQLKFYLSITDNTKIIGNLIDNSEKTQKLLEIQNQKNQIFFSYLLNKKKNLKILLKNSKQKSNLPLQSNNPLTTFAFSRQFNNLKNHKNTILELKNPIFLKEFKFSLKNSSLSRSSHEKTSNLLKQTNFGNNPLIVLNKRFDNQEGRLTKKSNHSLSPLENTIKPKLVGSLIFQPTFQSDKNQYCSILPTSHAVWSHLYVSKLEHLLMNIALKFEIFKNKAHFKLIQNHFHRKSLNVEISNTISENLTTLNFDLPRININVATHYFTNFRFVDLNQKTVKVLKKSPDGRKSILVPTTRKPKTTKVLQTFLSSKLDLKKQFSNTMKNEMDSDQFLEIKKNYLKTLLNLKQYLKQSNLYLSNFTLMSKRDLKSSGLKAQNQNKLDIAMVKSNQKQREIPTFSLSKKPKTRKNLKRMKNNRFNMNSNTLLKRLGFLFLNQLTKNPFDQLKNESINFTSSEVKIWKKLEQKKAEQKKHRRKKQNLETRRRKKRKRFYPRPHLLRFQLYKNFFQNRHFKRFDPFNQPKQHYKTEKNSLWLLNKISENKANLWLKKMITEKTQSKISLLKNQRKLLVNKKVKDFIFQNKKYYNVKQRIYRNNKEKWGILIQDKPEVEKAVIKKHSQIFPRSILANQNFYKISNTVMGDFQRLCWKSYWLRSNLNPYVKRIQNNLKQIQNYHKFMDSEIAFKNNFSSFLGIQFKSLQFFKPEKLTLEDNLPLGWYLNYNNALNQSNTLTSISILQQKENLSAYNQIIYNRMGNIIKNVKTNLNTSGQIKTISYLQGHRKNNGPSRSINTWSEYFYDFISYLKTLKIGKEQTLVITKPGDISFKTFCIPPYELTTLRLLWSLNQTNLLSFKQNNDVKKTWEYIKIREQNKSNKTKKFILQNFKSIFPKNLENWSLEKTQRIYKKLSWYKANLNSKFLNEKNPTKYHFTNFRELKFQLKAKTNDYLSNFQNQRPFDFKNFSITTNKENLELTNRQKSNFYNSSSFKKSQKQSLNFWWSTENMVNSVFKLPITHSENDFKSFEKYSFFQSLFMLNSLWIFACLFHLSILFSLIRISEIRSLSKFYFLIISKMSESYTLILDGVYKLLMKANIEISKTLKTVKTGFKTLKYRKQNRFENDKLTFSSNSKTFISISKYSKINLMQKFVFRTPQVSFKNFYSISVNKRLPGKAFTNNSWTIFRNQTFLTKQFLNYWRQKRVNSLGFERPQSRDTNHLINLKTLKRFREKFHTWNVLPSFVFLKTSLLFFERVLNLIGGILFKLTDLVESFVMIVYKFLEKPAELLIDWIGQIFLIEWSSDTVSFLPDLLDTQIWISFSKVFRGTRVNPLLGFLMQRRLWCLMQVVVDSITRPETDLLERQKKGIIFWDIWAEVLIQAAENYKMNLSSFMTLKEEQEIFMEKILADSNWNWSYEAMRTMSPLISFIEKDNGSNLNLSFQVKENFQSLGNKKLLKNSFSASNLVSNSVQLSKNSKMKKRGNFSYFYVSKQIKPFQTFSISPELKLKSSNLQFWKRWAVNQAFTYQGIDTDLFVDLHPPKSFQHIQFLKSSQLAQQTLGPLVCQIYSGIFASTIAKNILVVGSPGSAKSLFIQALAGETELKIMLDNAQRYAVIQRGVAVGMKLLRDVFDAIALHTPCIFLMEDIHLIGERRPMLISDQENAFSGDSIFNLAQEEIHEKNQLLYQWSRHNISHYRRPYKSDFSIMIPTNHFCFDMFLGISPNQIRQQGRTAKYPLPIENIENQLNLQNVNSLVSLESKTETGKASRNANKISYLQLSKEHFFTPPATSPFLIFALKEQQQVKPKKQVKQIPWGGFSFDQMNLLPKVSYSIRIKVALLADLAIRNLSVKLDMITDLLVILDNVRSNHGFVVFATTHVPSLLDPALRRPGRFDETIAIPILPNLTNRWEILKTNLADFSSSVDFLDYGILTSMLNESQLLKLFDHTKLSLFNTQIPTHLSSNSLRNFEKTETIKNINFQTLRFLNLTSQNHSYKKWLSWSEPDKISNRITQADLETISINQLLTNKSGKLSEGGLNFFNTTIPLYSLNEALKVKLESSILTSLKRNKRISAYERKKGLKNVIFGNKDFLRKFKFYPSLTPNSSALVSLTYFKIGSFFINANFLKQQTSYQFVMWTKLNQVEQTEQFIFKQLYAPQYELKNQLIQFFSGQITELFSMNQYLTLSFHPQNTTPASKKSHLQIQFPTTEKLIKPFCFNEQYRNVGGFEFFWKAATSFILYFLQKRFLHQKNLITSKILSFDDFSLLTKPISPPSSSILVGVKKSENFQRMHFVFQHKTKLSINQKLQIHQQQRLMKNLYQKSIKNMFISETIPNHFTHFNSSGKELGYFDSIMLKPTSMNAYYNNRILIRHKFSLIPQWWTAQLAEYTVETTFLSDVDWRSMFIKSIGDLVIDFPDSEQYYNPRFRRWFTNSTSWNYWLNFDKILSNEIANHFMIECFNNASQKLESHREILDYYAYRFLKSGILKEIDLITIKSRFYLA